MKVASTLFCSVFLATGLQASPSLDPAALAFSTYLPNGLARIFSAAAVAVDHSGAIYVTGATTAPFDTFPFPGPQTPFVMKLSPQGEVLYTTIFPGTGTSSATAIAVDDRGEVAIAGYSNGTLPQIGGLAPAFRGGDFEAFAAKLGAGGEILYLTTLGGALRELAWGVDMDRNGALYVTGETGSPDFPQIGPVPLPRGAAEDVFLIKLVPGSPQPAWSLAFGGSGRDQPDDLAVNAAGRSYLTGATLSADFPTAHAFQPEHAGGLDGFAVSLDAEGGQAIYSTFLGGRGDDGGLGIDLGAAGVAWIGGITGSADFPLADPLQPTFQGGHADGFVAGLSAAGALVSATYFGGAGIDYVADLAVGRAGQLYLAGATGSLDFPLVDPVQETCRPAHLNGITCATDAFIATLDPAAPSLLFSTYLGGSVPSLHFLEPDDVARRIAVDSGGNATVVGGTSSRDFPLVNPIFTEISTLSGSASFVTRFLAVNQPPDCSGATATPAVIWPPNKRMVSTALAGVTDPDSDPVTLEVTSIRQDEPLTGRSPDASGVGTAQPRVRAARAGGGDGRVYLISFEATDPSGASCTGTVKICVPHDRGRGTTCGDSGVRVDSTGGD